MSKYYDGLNWVLKEKDKVAKAQPFDDKAYKELEEIESYFVGKLKTPAPSGRVNGIVVGTGGK